MEAVPARNADSVEGVQATGRRFRLGAKGRVTCGANDIRLWDAPENTERTPVAGVPEPNIGEVTDVVVI